jgi:hypothetical protein
MSRDRAYAEDTKVSVGKSQGDLVTLLTKFDADQVGHVLDNKTGEAVVFFTREGRQYRLGVPMPKKSGLTDRQFDQKCRSRWRALLLLIKAKMVGIDCGATTFEEEFLAHTVTAQGERLVDALRKPLEEHYETGQPVNLLGAWKKT